MIIKKLSIKIYNRKNIGKIPIMLKSSICILNQYSQKEKYYK